MKKVALFAALLLASFAGGFVAQYTPGLIADEPRAITFNELRASSITLKGEHGETAITPGGVWVTNKTGQCVSIYAQPGVGAVGIFSDMHNTKGCNIAISADKENGQIQMVDQKTGDVRFQEFKNFPGGNLRVEK